MTALMLACEKGDLESVKNLIEEQKMNVNLANEFGEGPFMFACGSGNLKLVKYLVEVGACVDLELYVDNGSKVANQYCLTPLMKACKKGNLEIVKYLVEKGADINFTDVYRDTPLVYALNQVYGNSGDTPLVYIRSQGHLETVKYLIATRKLTEESWSKALDIAKSKGYKEVETLLQTFNKSSDVQMEDVESNQNFTPDRLVVKGEHAAELINRYWKR
jgi:ankyrin repeat protein